MANELMAYHIVPLYNIDPLNLDPKILPNGYTLISNQEFFAKYRSSLTNYLGDLEEDIKIIFRGQIYKRLTAKYLLIKELGLICKIVGNTVLEMI